MLLIQHRVNTVKELRNLPEALGVELDLRACGESIILQHDAFKDGENFEEYLKHYSHGTMILNVKTEGIEENALVLIKKYKVRDYFFLDLAFPAMMKLIRRSENRIAARFSELEPLEQCLALKNKVDWVWVDCFTRMPLTDENYSALKEHFKLCLVSPELQNHPKEKIADFRAQLTKFPLDAVCTKYPELWK